MISNDKAINKDELAVNLNISLVAKTGLKDNDANKQLLNNLTQSVIFRNQLDCIKIMAERSASELFKKYLIKVS